MRHGPVIIRVVTGNVGLRTDHGPASHDEAEGTTRNEHGQWDANEPASLHGSVHSDEEAEHAAHHGPDHSSLYSVVLRVAGHAGEPLPLLLACCQGLRVFNQIGEAGSLQLHVVEVCTLIGVRIFLLPEVPPWFVGGGRWLCAIHS